MLVKIVPIVLYNYTSKYVVLSQTKNPLQKWKAFQPLTKRSG